MSHKPFPRLSVGSVNNLATGGAGVINTQNFGSDTVGITRHAVTFPTPFTAQPLVVVSTNNSNVAGHGTVINMWVENGTVTTTGFNLLVSDIANSANIGVSWFAVEQESELIAFGQSAGLNNSQNETGSATLNGTVFDVSAHPITFGRTFSKVPRVVCCMQGNDNGHGTIANVWANNITTTGFNGCMTDWTNSSTHQINWIAMSS